LRTLVLSALSISACAEIRAAPIVEAPSERDSGTDLGVPTVDPVTPLPSSEQLAWQTQELSAFLHFGINTFSDKEQGDGTDSPAIFNPTGLDPNQWMATLRGAGFRQAMLTAKHHDGFCLWPTKCTAYSVASTPWQSGQGDVAKSWVASGPNQTISPNDLASALGADQISTLMSHTGLSRDELLAGLSQHLPDVVNHLTPDGHVPTEQELSRLI